MPSFNQTILMGNLTRDPEIKYLSSQKAVCNFGLAVNAKWKDATGQKMERVDYFDLTAFGATADAIGKYFQKGRAIFVVGRLRYESWEDKQSRQKRSRVTVNVDSFQFVDSDGRPAGDTPPQTPRDKAASTRRPPPGQPAGSDDGLQGDEQPFKDDDIPF